MGAKNECDLGMKSSQGVVFLVMTTQGRVVGGGGYHGVDGRAVGTEVQAL